MLKDKNVKGTSIIYYVLNGSHFSSEIRILEVTFIRIYSLSSVVES